MKEKVYTLSEMQDLVSMFESLYHEIKVSQSFNRIMRRHRRPIAQRS